MIASDIVVCAAWTELAAELARAARLPPDVASIAAGLASVEGAVTALENTFDDPDAFAVEARRAHLRALRLASVLARFPATDREIRARIARFDDTAWRLLATVERWAPRAQRALAIRLLGRAALSQEHWI